jgi:hypothetical protein
VILSGSAPIPRNCQLDRKNARTAQVAQKAALEESCEKPEVERGIWRPEIPVEISAVVGIEILLEKSNSASSDFTESSVAAFRQCQFHSRRLLPSQRTIPPPRFDEARRRDRENNKSLAVNLKDYGSAVTCTEFVAAA